MRSMYCDERLAPVCLLLMAVLTVFRSHWEMSTSMFLGTYHRTSWSFRVPARTSKKTILEQRGMRGPFSDNAAAHVPTDNQIHLLHCSAGPPNHWGFWKAWPGGFLSAWPFTQISCQIFDVKLEQHCHSPRITDARNCKTKMSKSQGLVPGSGSSWVGQLQRITE